MFGPRAQTGHPARQRIFFLLMLFIPLAATGVVGEFLVRLMFGSPPQLKLPLLVIEPHPDLAWIMRPNSFHYTWGHPVSTNELGLRAAPIRKKAENEFRILALGDSMVFGRGVELADTIPGVIERSLLDPAPSGRRIAVVNAGVQGYSTNQELTACRLYGEKIQPDLVILFWFWNDFTEEINIPAVYSVLRQRGPCLFGFDTRKLPLRFYPYYLLRQSALALRFWDIAKAYRAKDPSRAAIDAGYRKLHGYLEDLNNQARSQHFQPVVVVIPDATEILGETWTRQVGSEVAKIAAEHRIPTISVLSSLRAAYDRDRMPIIPFDGHYNAEGNRTIGRAVTQSLVKTGQIPR